MHFNLFNSKLACILGVLERKDARLREKKKKEREMKIVLLTLFIIVVVLPAVCLSAPVLNYTDVFVKNGTHY